MGFWRMHEIGRVRVGGTWGLRGEGVLEECWIRVLGAGACGGSTCMCRGGGGGVVGEGADWERGRVHGGGTGVV